jgi:hypothetical protein
MVRYPEPAGAEDVQGVEEVIEALVGFGAAERRARRRLLPGAENADVGGVHDADGEPDNSGGVVGEVPVHVGEVPD